jgi:hypothetical protein
MSNTFYPRHAIVCVGVTPYFSYILCNTFTSARRDEPSSTPISVECTPLAIHTDSIPLFLAPDDDDVYLEKSQTRDVKKLSSTCET